jgi:hypothetical protein
MNREEKEKQEEMEQQAEQASEIRQLIGSMLGEDKYNLGSVMSALLGMLVTTALDQAKMPPEALLLIVAQAVNYSVEADKELLEEERKGIKWLN